VKPLLTWLKRRWNLVLAASTLPCRQVAQLASRRYEHPLNPWIRLRIRVHLTICEACERYLRQLDFLHQAASQCGEKCPKLDADVHLAADARERLKVRLRRESIG
jgi:hypothetical protein